MFVFKFIGLTYNSGLLFLIFYSSILKQRYLVFNFV